MMSITNEIYENQILYEESPPKASPREKTSRKSSKRKLNDAEDDRLNDDLVGNKIQASSTSSSFVIFGRSVSISTFLDQSNTTPILLPTLSHRPKLKKHL